MGNIEHQKQVALKLLHTLEAADPMCILAGGAPRDWYFNRPCNDLDFYIHIPGVQCCYDDLRFERLGLKVKRMACTREREHHYKEMEHLARIYEGVEEGVPYQIMVMRQPTPDCVVDSFGSSVCMAWWKGDEVVPTLDFLVSHYTNTNFIKDDYTAKEAHIKKMVDKFPEYEVMKFKSIQGFYDKLHNEFDTPNFYSTLDNKLKEKINE